MGIAIPGRRRAFALVPEFPQLGFFPGNFSWIDRRLGGTGAGLPGSDGWGIASCHSVICYRCQPMGDRACALAKGSALVGGDIPGGIRGFFHLFIRGGVGLVGLEGCFAGHEAGHGSPPEIKLFAQGENLDRSVVSAGSL